MKNLLLLIIMLGLVPCVMAQGMNDDPDSRYATELLKPGTMAPDFQLRTIDGKKFKLSKLRGHYVVLDFWASWCPDCRKDAPNLVRMYNRFHDKGVEFVGVSFDDNASNWQSAVDKYQIPYTQVSELKKWKETTISPLYGVKWIPSMYLIDPEGKVVLGTVVSDKVEAKLYELTAPAPSPIGIKETVWIDGAKGRLRAVVQRPEMSQGRQCPMVLFCHGFGGTKEGPLFEITADSLCAHGIASIRFDFNGHGESEGDFQEMTVPNEIEDAKKVYEYVLDLRYVSEIAIVGHSQGGVVSAMTAGELGSDAFKAVVLLAPAAVLRDDAIRGNTMGKMYDPLDPPEYVELWDGKRLGRDYIKTAFWLPIYETAARYQGPALIVHGTADRVVPYTYGERFHQVWPGSQWELLDGLDHGFMPNVYRADQLVIDYLVKSLNTQQ